MSSLLTTEASADVRSWDECWLIRANIGFAPSELPFNNNLSGKAAFNPYVFHHKYPI